MQRRKVRIREHSLLARLAACRLRASRVAMVVGRTIHLHNVSQTDFLRSPDWVCHELRHVVQYEQYGTAGFLLRYLWESMRNGYVRNRFEVEARAAEHDRSLLELFEFE